MRVLYVGSGAVNLCLAAFMHSGVSKTQFLVRTETNPMIASGKFVCKLPKDKSSKIYDCEAVASLNGVKPPDLIVIGVKNYSLENVLDAVESAFGRGIPVMSVLNGVEHVKLISERFSHPIFATIIYNAYRTTPSHAIAVGDALALSSSNPATTVYRSITKILKPNTSLTIVDSPVNSSYCKLVINLGNALLAIVGFHEHRKRELDVLQKLTAELMNEGIDVLQKLNVKEARIKGMPNWFLIRSSKKLPQWISVPIFKKKIETNAINSMAQDLQKGADQTELEDINGEFLKMAKRAGIEIPYNRALYHIFKKWHETKSQPLTPSELLAGINSFSNR